MTRSDDRLLAAGSMQTGFRIARLSDHQIYPFREDRETLIGLNRASNNTPG